MLASVNAPTFHGILVRLGSDCRTSVHSVVKILVHVCIQGLLRRSISEEDNPSTISDMCKDIWKAIFHLTYVAAYECNEVD